MLIFTFPSILVYLLCPLLFLITDIAIKNLLQTNFLYLFLMWTVAATLNTQSPFYIAIMILGLICQVTILSPGLTFPIGLMTMQLVVLVIGVLIKRNFAQQTIFPYTLALLLFFINPETRSLVIIFPHSHPVWGFTFFCIKLILNLYCFSRFLKYTSAAKPGNRL